jgi:hypothetical protein
MCFRSSANRKPSSQKRLCGAFRPFCWKDMQSRADETERPLVWPGVTVGSVSLNRNPESLSGICARREVMVDLASAMPTNVRRSGQRDRTLLPISKGSECAVQGATTSAYV